MIYIIISMNKLNKTQLREIANKLNIDVSKVRTKKHFIKLIEEKKSELSQIEADRKQVEKTNIELLYKDEEKEDEEEEVKTKNQSTYVNFHQKEELIIRLKYLKSKLNNRNISKEARLRYQNTIKKYETALSKME